jgi:hypothetical protein
MEKPLIRQIGRYKLLDVLGQGGMGIVWRAVDAGIGRTVAIKMLHGSYAQNSDLLTRFYREVQSTANLQHKNIVTVYALDEFEGFPYMVMEFLQGQSMAEIISSKKPLNLVEKLGLVSQICEGLQYAHEHGVMHRDIKPANVLVLTDGTAKIVDFGIARATATDTLTQTGQVIGSIHYMSPEQIGAAPVDSRTDIYSTGVLLFQFLTGDLPFKAPNDADPQATFMKILNDPVPPLGKYLAEYPKTLDDILAKAMAKDVSLRYQTADELGYDLVHLKESLERQMTDEFLSKAKEAIREKEWERARQQLQEILKVERRHGEANDLLQGVRREIQKQQKEVQISQLRAQAQIALAGLHYEEAAECVEQARRLDPDDRDLLELSLSIKERAEKSRQLGEALSRGQAALYAGDLKEAELEVRKALAIDAHHTEAQSLDTLIRKEYEERTRRSKLQGFIEEARREITNHNFLQALISLEKAQEIDPSDSNIRELVSWAARGHEQEKLRIQLQQCANEIGQLLGDDRYEEALASCEAALLRYPDEPSLLKLKQLASHQRGLVLRRLAVDTASAEARRLADAEKYEDAVRVLERSLLSFPGEPNLETLLAITRTEAERKRKHIEDQERFQAIVATESKPSQGEEQKRHEVDQLIRALQSGLAKSLPIAQLKILAERAAKAVDPLGPEIAASTGYAATTEEFNLRWERWKRDCSELEQLNESVRSAKGSSEIAFFIERARFIAERHASDEEVTKRYRQLVELAEAQKTQQQEAVAKLSSVLRSVENSPNLPELVNLEHRVTEIASAWEGNTTISGLANQASVRIDEARNRRQNALDELARMKVALSTATSAGQVRLLADQSKILSSDTADNDVRKANADLQDDAQAKLDRLERTVSELQDLAVKASSALTLSEAEKYSEVAQLVVLQEAESEEAGDLLRKLQHVLEERKRKYRRIQGNLEQLTRNSANATGQAELDLILARRRDLLRKYGEDPYFQEVDAALDASVRDRRASLIELASAMEPNEAEDAEYSEDVSSVEKVDRSKIPTVDVSPLVNTVPVRQTARRRVIVVGAVIAGAFAGIGVLTLFLLGPKSVTIQTSPATASLTVDGQICGNPCNIRLGIGKHELLATQSDFSDLRRTITVPLLGVKLGVFEMSPAPKPKVLLPTVTESIGPVPQDARILIKTSTADATVYVDDSRDPIGSTHKDGRYEVKTTDGMHRIRVEKSGYETSPTQTIAASSHKPASATFDLKAIPGPEPPKPNSAANPKSPDGRSGGSLPSQTSPEPALLESFLVVQAPVGAEIHIDEQRAGLSTGGRLRIKVEPGSHTVEVILAGDQPWKKLVPVDPGKEENVEASLIPLPAINTPHNSPNSPAAPAVSEEDRKQIQQLLDQYADAYNTKNIKLIQTLWPSIPADEIKTIKGFFKDSKLISMQIRLTNATPAGKRITIDCTQTLRYEMDGKKDGNTRSKTMYVTKNDAGWLIEFIPIS